MKRNVVSLLFYSLLIGLIGCADDALFENHTTLKRHRWITNQKIDFTANVNDISVPYDVYFNFRHTLEYPFSNMVVQVHQHNPDSTRKTYRFGFKLATQGGRWLGTGSGNMFSHRVPFLKNIHFPDTGIYTFQIEPYMQLNPLPGISDIGLRIQPAKK